MNLFTAAVYTNSFMETQTGSRDKLSDFEKTHFDGIPHILESWHYVGRQRYVDEMRANSAQIFLDSGAFSAWTLGTTLSLDKYCEYINRNRDIFIVEDGDLMVSVLDGIGDPLQTYRNQLEMEQKGVRPLPCFHFGEDERYLEHYINNYTYITIGGMVGKSRIQLSNWLERIFNDYICDSSGNPRLKVHGFGLTSIPLMRDFPWYSCDSSSWIQYAVYGHIFHPELGVVTVSEKSPRRHDAGMHITTFTDIEKAAMESIINKIGFDVERLSTVYESRAAFNMWSFREINKMLNSVTRGSRTVKQELF